MTGIFNELRRRNVIKVALFYVVSSWLLLQIADLLFDLLGLPDWSLRLVFGLLALGLPLVLAFSWIFEVTPDGIVRETQIDRDASIVGRTGHKLNVATVLLLVVAIGMLGAQWYLGNGGDGAAADGAAVTPPPVAAPVAAPAASPPTEPVGEASDAGPSVAVLPFRNMSPDPDQVYFSEGLSDTLIHVLAQISELRVAARTSSFAFQDQAVDVREIARQLGVGAILEGSVQRAGNQLRIIAQLIDASDGTHLWSGTFDRSTDDIFAVQDEIANEVLSALKSTLLAAGEEQIAARYRPTIEAYEEFLLGRQKLATRRSDKIIEAAAHFRQAYELDPNYALALVNLADAIYLQAEYAGRSFSDVIEESLPLVRAALALDPKLGEAHASLAVRQGQQGQVEEAEASFKRALELAPNYASAYHWYAMLLRDESRPEESLAMIRRAAQLDPLHTSIRAILWGQLDYLGYWDEADELARQTLEREPDNVHFLTIEAGRERQGGDLVTAVETYARIVAIDPGQPGPLGGLCDALAELPDLDLARTCVERYYEAFPDQPPYDSVWLDMLAMDLDQASEKLRRYGESAPDGDRFWRLFEGSVQMLRRDWQGALDGWIAAFPEYGEERPTLDEYTWRGWPVVALFHSRLGHDEIVAHLSSELWPILDSRPSRVRGDNVGISDAILYMAEDRTEEALGALVESVEAGSFGAWRHLLVNSPIFEPLHDDDRYRSLVARIEADLREQQATIEARLAADI